MTPGQHQARNPEGGATAHHSPQVAGVFHLIQHDPQRGGFSRGGIRTQGGDCVPDGKRSALQDSPLMLGRVAERFQFRGFFLLDGKPALSGQLPEQRQPFRGSAAPHMEGPQFAPPCPQRCLDRIKTMQQSHSTGGFVRGGGRGFLALAGHFPESGKY